MIEKKTFKSSKSWVNLDNDESPGRSLFQFFQEEKSEGHCSNPNCTTAPSVKDKKLQKLSEEMFEAAISSIETRCSSILNYIHATQKSLYNQVEDNFIISESSYFMYLVGRWVKVGKKKSELVEKYYNSFLSLVTYYCGSLIQNGIKEMYTIETFITDFVEIRKISKILKDLTFKEKVHCLVDKLKAKKISDNEYEVGDITVRLNGIDHKIESGFWFFHPENGEKTFFFKWTENGLLVPARKFPDLWVNADYTAIEELMNKAHVLHKTLQKDQY